MGYTTQICLRRLSSGRPGSRSVGLWRGRKGTHIFDSSIERCPQRFWVIGGVSDQGATLMRDD